jgi:predicted transposase/invertase (TIGR01784 family)
MKRPNYEDFIMKRAMHLFADEGLKFFGISQKVKSVGATELVVLEAKNMLMDYTFLMEDDTFIHFEFQTTDKGHIDLRRFRSYEALLSHQTGKHVITYVIYSGDLNKPSDSLQTGINLYKIKTMSLATHDGDIVLAQVLEKIEKVIPLQKEEMIALAFTPIMGGKLKKHEKILTAIKATQSIDASYRYDIQSILYAFANKFLDEKDLEKVKEELKMTELGKILVDEGIQQGKRSQSIETAKKAIKKGLDNETISELTGLTIQEIEILRVVND